MLHIRYETNLSNLRLAGYGPACFSESHITGLCVTATHHNISEIQLLIPHVFSAKAPLRNHLGPNMHRGGL